MASEPAAADVPDPPIQGAMACRDALRTLLVGLAAPPSAASQADPPSRPGQVVCIDHHFADWPFDDPAVQQALAVWLRGPGRRLQLIGVDFETTAHGLPRFSRWRRDFAHRIDAWCPVDGDLPIVLRGLLVGSLAWQRLDRPQPQLRRITNLVRVAGWQADIADFLQRCAPTWPVTTLGL